MVTGQMNTGHLQDNLCKTFKRRSGRLTNVLCTFNLLPVSNESFQ